MKENIDNYGEYFQQKSKYFPGKLPQHVLDWESKPDTYKTYPKSPKIIELPSPEFSTSIRFWDAIINRKSIRNFSNKPVTKMELSQLLYGMAGITRSFQGFAFRTTPSAGGLFPIEIYPAINNVIDVNQGLYHYNISSHTLELLKEGDYRREVAEGCLGQRMAYKSAINFIWTAMIERSKWKYLQRCYRYIYLDAGHIGQNFYLVAEALGLGACTIGAIFDDELNKLLEIDGNSETSIYVGVVGKRIKGEKI